MFSSPHIAVKWGSAILKALYPEQISWFTTSEIKESSGISEYRRWRVVSKISSPMESLIYSTVVVSTRMPSTIAAFSILVLLKVQLIQTTITNDVKTKFFIRTYLKYLFHPSRRMYHPVFLNIRISKSAILHVLSRELRTLGNWLHRFHQIKDFYTLLDEVPMRIPTYALRYKQGFI